LYMVIYAAYLFSCSMCGKFQFTWFLYNSLAQIRNILCTAGCAPSAQWYNTQLVIVRSSHNHRQCTMILPPCSNPRPCDHETYVLPLCQCRCPTLPTYLYIVIYAAYLFSCSTCGKFQFSWFLYNSLAQIRN
jgi:hypothetical protein